MFRPLFFTQFPGNTCSRHFLFRTCEGFFCVGCFHCCTICSRNDIYLTNLYYIEYLVLIYISYLDNIFQHNFPEILLLDVFCKEHEKRFSVTGVLTAERFADKTKLLFLFLFH